MGRFQIKDRQANVAAHLAGLSEAGQDVMDQGGGCGFPVGAGDADHARDRIELIPILGREGTEEQADIIVDDHAHLLGFADGGMRFGVEMRDARGDDQGFHVGPRLVAGQILDVETLIMGVLAGGFIVIPSNRLRPTCFECIEHREAGATEAEHCYFMAVIAANGDHRELLEMSTQIPSNEFERNNVISTKQHLFLPALLSLTALTACGSSETVNITSSGSSITTTTPPVTAPGSAALVNGSFVTTQGT